MEGGLGLDMDAARYENNVSIVSWYIVLIDPTCACCGRYGVQGSNFVFVVM